MMKDISDEEKARGAIFADFIGTMNWHSICLFTICTLKRVMPIWDQEVKKKYFIYADRVVGMRHKIPKIILGEYLAFLESNLEFWGIEEKVRNSDILELMTASIDCEFEVSTTASRILVAVYNLMCGVEKMKEDNSLFIESLEWGTMFFEEFDACEKFFLEVKVDFMNHPLYEKVQM